MKRLTNFTVIVILGMLFTFSALSNPQTVLDSHTSTGNTSDVWRKFIGETVPSGVPDVIDYSYAGYKQGSAIPVYIDLPIYYVLDYGAIPNDGQSDTNAIQQAINAASNGGGVVMIAPGQYDVFVSGEKEGTSGFVINGDNVVIRGCGAQGSEKGGTTIKAHNRINVFTTTYQSEGSTFNISGTIPRGSKYIDLVRNAHWLASRKFIIIKGVNLSGAEFAKHSSRTLAEIDSTYSNIQNNGIGIDEYHEIDRIEGNRVYLKSAIMTELNSAYIVHAKVFRVGIGIEDLHIDSSLGETYVHLDQTVRTPVSFQHVANSWIQRCRFSNSIDAFALWRSYCVSVISIVVDGKSGHYPGLVQSSSNCFVGLLEDYSDNGLYYGHHGLSVAKPSSGNVFWFSGGPSLHGADSHGAQPRHTLHDNYYSTTHVAQGGTYHNLPHHLDGYVRWNNHTEDSSVFELWKTSGIKFVVTSPVLVGYNQNGATEPQDAYVENLNSRVFPNSLYEAQLERRLGSLPDWVNTVKDEHRKFISQIFGSGTIPLSSRTPQVQDAILSIFPGKTNVNQIRPRLLSDIRELNLTNKSITELKEGDFEGFTSLVYMFLAHNQLTTLPENIFNGLDNIHSIYLHDNMISTLNSNTFSGLDTLQRIYLENNSLTSLPEGIFEGLAIDRIWIHKNTANPLPIPVTLKKVSANSFKVVVSTCAPFSMSVTVGVENGTLADGDNVVNISQGTSDSDVITVIRSGENLDVVVDILSLPDTQTIESFYHRGYIFIKHTDVPLSLSDGVGMSPNTPRIPTETKLLTNYPNPFNPETWIPYQLSKESVVNLSIYNVKGDIVRKK